MDFGDLLIKEDLNKQAADKAHDAHHDDRSLEGNDGVVHAGESPKGNRICDRGRQAAECLVITECAALLILAADHGDRLENGRKECGNAGDAGDDPRDHCARIAAHRKCEENADCGLPFVLQRSAIQPPGRRPTQLTMV